MAIFLDPDPSRGFSGADRRVHPHRAPVAEPASAVDDLSTALPGGGERHGGSTVWIFRSFDFPDHPVHATGPGLLGAPGGALVPGHVGLLTGGFRGRRYPAGGTAGGPADLGDRVLAAGGRTGAHGPSSGGGNVRRPSSDVPPCRGGARILRRPGAGGSIRRGGRT